jgi:hypothetical protein
MYEELVLPQHNILYEELVSREKKTKEIEKIKQEIQMDYFNSLSPSCDYINIDYIDTNNDKEIEKPPRIPNTKKLTPIKQEEEYETTYEDEEALDYQSPPEDIYEEYNFDD